MTQPSAVFMALILSAIIGIGCIASPVLDRSAIPASSGMSDVSARSTDTCADPSLAATVFEAYNSQDITHFLDFHYGFINVNSKTPGGPPAWSFQGPMFKAWATQQPFTSPLWSLATPSASEYIFLLGTDAQTPPVASGFNALKIKAWAYNSSVCGSVPLMSLVLASGSDHYYTTDPVEQAGLLADGGWTDGGIVAYVLPLPTF